jgi:hypothetical protein
MLLLPGRGWRYQLRTLLLFSIVLLIQAAEVHENGLCAMRGQVNHFDLPVDDSVDPSTCSANNFHVQITELLSRYIHNVVESNPLAIRFIKRRSGQVMWRIVEISRRLLHRRSSQGSCRQPPSGRINNLLLSSLQKELLRLFLYFYLFIGSVYFPQRYFYRATNR